MVGWPAALHQWQRRVDPARHGLGPQHDELRAELVAAIGAERRAIR